MSTHRPDHKFEPWCLMLPTLGYNRRHSKLGIQCICKPKLQFRKLEWHYLKLNDHFWHPLKPWESQWLDKQHSSVSRNRHSFCQPIRGLPEPGKPSAVDILQQHLLNIDGVDSAKLVSVHTFISRLEQEITTQNVFRYLEVDFKNSGAQDNSYKRNYQVCKSKLRA